MNLKEELSGISEYFSPKVIGELNDVYVKLVKIKGDIIPWHSHEKEDELFYVLKGSLLFEIEDEVPFMLNDGDMYIVPRGINHRISAKEECHIMLVENKSTKHTGEVTSEITKSIQEQNELFLSQNKFQL